MDVGGSERLHKLFVYDRPYHVLSHEVDLKGSPIKDLTQLALSPSGSRVAVLKIESSDRPLIEAFDLPTQ